MEAPIGDFFGLEPGLYVKWESLVHSAGFDKALNNYSPMPYAKHGWITVTDEGKQAIKSLYRNIDYRVDTRPLPADTLYFHAEYRQAQPNHGWTRNWYENGDPIVNYRRNLDGKDNYEWFTAKGHGQYVRVTFSVLQNQDAWWGEDNDMFQIFGDKPTIVGTGGEDYFSWVVGVHGSAGFSAAWRAFGRGADRGFAVEHVPVSFRLADSVHEVDAGEHRAWPCESPVGQLLFACVLVSGRAA